MSPFCAIFPFLLCRKWAGTRELAPTRPRIRAGCAQGTTSTSERGRAPSCPPLANWDRVTSACSWLEFPLALGFLPTGQGSWPESFKPGAQWPSHHPCSPSRAGCCPSAPDRSLARGFPWCGGELCFLLGERTALGSCSMSHSCAEPGSLSRLRKAPQERKLYIPPQLYAKGFLPPVSAPFLLLGEHEVDGEDPQASAGTRDSYNCDFPPALVKGTSRILLGMYQLSCWSFSMEYLNTKGENGASRQEEEKPRDSSLSPRQPMNCLAGNGGTGWTLHCSLGMCGTAGTPGAAWADGLDAPASPFLPSHWGRVQWWHCQPCSGMEPGKCTELSPGIERDQAREVKKEGRREVRQQASSTKLLCKQS
ncbi:uncharacterized protein LOC127472726 [Manacus candei]|uniref:uncharacterized protein LOC127472726 n=1 Tax=Manacus candei TaxID=415023 RepID=UPI0022271981|nr:uncharacterized protein LOC127472726 [Manacus candei]